MTVGELRNAIAPFVDDVPVEIVSEGRQGTVACKIRFAEGRIEAIELFVKEGEEWKP